jgi:dTDP-4-dehydrorhamnose reductase
MPKPKIAVTGAGGQLGRELQEIARKDDQFEYIFLTRDQLPVQDPQQVEHFFATSKPDYCVNCAAYTAVDKAESEREQAFLINGKAVGYLGVACRQAGTRLVHISTDYVFNGNSEKPLTEADPTDPLNSYGASKLEGERQALAYEQSIVIRTAWVYSEYGSNFVKTMLRLMKERSSLRVVDDQIGAPTYAADLAAAIVSICRSGRFVPGLYHYSNEGRISWYEFALAIRDLAGLTCEVVPIPSDQYPTPAKRPRFSLLDKTKIKSVYGIPVPDWRSSLEICIRKLTKV